MPVAVFAVIAATLCEILEDGSVTRVSYGILNLTHRNSHERPEALKPGVPARPLSKDS